MKTYEEMHTKIKRWAEQSKNPEVHRGNSYMWHYVDKSNPSLQELVLMKNYLFSQGYPTSYGQHKEIMKLMLPKINLECMKIWMED